MVETILRFRSKKAQRHSSAFYVALPSEIYTLWNLYQSKKLEVGLLKTGDIIIFKPKDETENKSK